MEKDNKSLLNKVSIYDERIAQVNHRIKQLLLRQNKQLEERVARRGSVDVKSSERYLKTRRCNRLEAASRINIRDQEAQHLRRSVDDN